MMRRKHKLYIMLFDLKNWMNWWSSKQKTIVILWDHSIYKYELSISTSDRNLSARSRHAFINSLCAPKVHPDHVSQLDQHKPHLQYSSKYRAGPDHCTFSIEQNSVSALQSNLDRQGRTETTVPTVRLASIRRILAYTTLIALGS